MDEATYNKTIRENEGLIVTIAKANNFSGADLDDIVQEIKLNFWKTRDRKRSTQSDKAYLIGVARKTCAMAIRGDHRMMRDAPEFRFEERDTGEFTSGTINGKDIFKSADQERLADRHRLNDDLVALAGMMRSTHENVVLNRLKADAEDVRTPAPANKISMLRASRRLLGLPEDNPGRIEITNPAAHVARVVRDAGRRRPAPPNDEPVRINRPFRKETPCAAASSQTITRKREDATQVQKPTFDLSTEASTPSFSMKTGRGRLSSAGSRSFDRRRSNASSLPKGDCARSTPPTNKSARFLPPAGPDRDPRMTNGRLAPTTRRATTPSSTKRAQTTSAPARKDGRTRSGQ